jgi:hypothetical protein
MLSRRIRAFIEGEGWQSWLEALVSNVFKTVNTEPDAPSQPYDKLGASTATSIVLKWEAGPSNGKSIGRSAAPTERESWGPRAKGVYGRLHTRANERAD